MRFRRRARSVRGSRGRAGKAAGFRRIGSDDVSYAGYANGSVTIYIGESQPRRVIRKPPTGKEFVVIDHVGFATGLRSDVDAIASAMLEAGVNPLFPAQEYPEFGEGFYAVTFCDADNNVIEFGHRAVRAGGTPPTGE